jgi:hypothetical protein
MEKALFTVPQRLLPKHLGVPASAIRLIRDQHLVKGEDWIGGKTCLYSDGGVQKLLQALSLPQKTAALFQIHPSPEKPQRDPFSSERDPVKKALVVFKCAPQIRNTRIIECYPYGETPDPAHLVLVWVKQHLHHVFRPRQLIPPEHLAPYGVSGQWVYLAPGAPRRQV